MALLPEQFWRLTFAEYIAMAKGFRKRQVHRANELLYLAWHTEALARMDPLPALKDLQLADGTDELKKGQTDAEMESRIRVLNAMFHGTEVEV